MTHQPTWLAAANEVLKSPCIDETTTEPMTATPSDWPTCRLVEATAAATPAWLIGMPETAVLVIGAFSMPKPRPKIVYVASSHQIDVVSDRLVSMNPAAVIVTPAIPRGRRVPRRPTIRPEIGAKMTVITANGSALSPAWSGVKPRTFCRYRVLRSRKPASAANPHSAMTVAPENGTLRKNRGSISGSTRRLS